MKYRDYIVESPQLFDGTDFGMGDRTYNREQTSKWLKKKVEEFGEDKNSVLFRTGDKQNGSYVLYNKDTKLTDYFIRYEYKKVSGHGLFVTQVLLWRRKSASFNGRSVTDHVFFDILLPKYKRIASDQQQTEAGRDFWIRILSLANGKSHRIGILEKGKEVEYFDESKTSYMDWMDEKELTSWGEDESKRMIRFIIEEK